MLSTIKKVALDQRGGVNSAEILMLVSVAAVIALAVTGRLVPAFENLHGAVKTGIGAISETGW